MSLRLYVHAGVASGMPCKAEWIPLLKAELSEETQWQVIAIGREDATWPTLRKAAELGGHVRTGMPSEKILMRTVPFPCNALNFDTALGLEDTFYLPNGQRAGPLHIMTCILYKA